MRPLDEFRRAVDTSKEHRYEQETLIGRDAGLRHGIRPDRQQHVRNTGSAAAVRAAAVIDGPIESVNNLADALKSGPDYAKHSHEQFDFKLRPADHNAWLPEAIWR
jgi:hypothetical protein